MNSMSASRAQRLLFLRIKCTVKTKELILPSPVTEAKAEQLLSCDKATLYKQG